MTLRLRLSLAHEELLDKGLLVRRRGIGTQVVHGRVKRKAELTGVHLRVASQRIGARGASSAERKLFELRKGAPVLTMERTTYDGSGRAVELGLHAYVGKDVLHRDDGHRSLTRNPHAGARGQRHVRRIAVRNT